MARDQDRTRLVAAARVVKRFPRCRAMVKPDCQAVLTGGDPRVIDHSSVTCHASPKKTVHMHITLHIWNQLFTFISAMPPPGIIAPMPELPHVTLYVERLA